MEMTEVIVHMRRSVHVAQGSFSGMIYDDGYASIRSRDARSPKEISTPRRSLINVASSARGLTILIDRLGGKETDWLRLLIKVQIKTWQRFKASKGCIYKYKFTNSLYCRNDGIRALMMTRDYLSLGPMNEQAVSSEESLY